MSNVGGQPYRIDWGSNAKCAVIHVCLKRESPEIGAKRTDRNEGGKYNFYKRARHSLRPRPLSSRCKRVILNRCMEGKWSFEFDAGIAAEKKISLRGMRGSMLPNFSLRCRRKSHRWLFAAVIWKRYAKLNVAWQPRQQPIEKLYKTSKIWIWDCVTYNSH